jgi:hypothetical protein
MDKINNVNNIFIQKGLKISKEQKRQSIFENLEDENVQQISLKNLYDKINKYRQIGLDEYHEFILINTTSDKCKLFFDIDTKSGFLLSEPKLNKEIDIFKTQICDIILKNIVNNSVYSIKKYNIDKEITADDICKNIYITKSTDINKLSLHIFINNIIMNTYVFKTLKTLFANYKNKNFSCLLIKNIDLAVFKNEPILRIPYSKKENSEYYHMEYNFKLTQNNLYKILFSTFKNEKILFEIENNTTSFNVEQCIDESKNTIFPHQSEFLGYQLHETMVDRSILFTKKYLENYNELRKIEGVYTNYKFYLNFKSNTKIDCWCGRVKEHKNKHFILFTDDEIFICKEGNSRNCINLHMDYPKLNTHQITNYILKLNIFKKMIDKSFMYWDNVLWQQIDDDDIFTNISFNYLKNFNYQDRDFITNRYFHDAKKRLKTGLALQKQRYCSDPYFIQFTNGIYDIKNDKFIKHCKDYICKYNLNFDYKELNEMPELEQKKELLYNDKLITLLNNIIPENTYDRILFECNMCTCLLNINKPVLTFLIGETGSGKTTIKHLISNLLGDLYIDLPTGIYTCTSNEKSNPLPNPFLAQAGQKTCSFASEMGANSTLKGERVKKATENIIMARKLHDNNSVHTNVLTQVVDTNFVPVFDNSDPAVYRRICFININYSYFTDKNNIHASVINNRNIIKRDINLHTEILSNSFRRSLFILFKNWIRKYHLGGLKLKVNMAIHNNKKNPNKQIPNITKNIDVKKYKMLSEDEYKKIMELFAVDSKDFVASDIIDIYMQNYITKKYPEVVIQMANFEYVRRDGIIVKYDIKDKEYQYIMTQHLHLSSLTEKLEKEILKKYGDISNIKSIYNNYMNNMKT